jgi:hypothetical protein
LFDTCKNRSAFTSDDLWRRRTRACVEATASLVCYSDAELGWFGDILRPLGDIGRFEDIRNLSLSERDQTFVVRWTCLSIMAIRGILRSDVSLKEDARLAVASFGELQHGDCTDEAAEKNAREIDQTLDDLFGSEPRRILHYFRDFFQQAADMMREIDGMQSLESRTVHINEAIDKVSHRTTRQLPGVYFDFPDSDFDRQTTDLFRDPPKLQFTSCRQPFFRFADHIDHIIKYNANSMAERVLALKELVWPKNSMQRRLRNLQDLRDSGGLGFTVELFLLALRQLLSPSSSLEPYSALFIITFKAITSDWRRYKHSLGTQKILLDAVASDQGFLRMFDYPNYITDELWELLGDMLEGETGSHIDSAVQQLSDHQRENGDRYGTKASAVISRLRASCSQGPSVSAA